MLPTGLIVRKMGYFFHGKEDTAIATVTHGYCPKEFAFTFCLEFRVLFTVKKKREYAYVHGSIDWTS